MFPFLLFSADHIHRQNCLEDYGVKLAVQKLQKIDNSGLQDMWESGLPFLKNFVALDR